MSPCHKDTVVHIKSLPLFLHKINYINPCIVLINRKLYFIPPTFVRQSEHLSS